MFFLLRESGSKADPSFLEPICCLPVIKERGNYIWLGKQGFDCKKVICTY